MHMDFIRLGAIVILASAVNIFVSLIASTVLLFQTNAIKYQYAGQFANFKNQTEMLQRRIHSALRLLRHKRHAGLVTHRISEIQNVVARPHLKMSLESTSMRTKAKEYRHVRGVYYDVYHFDAHCPRGPRGKPGLNGEDGEDGLPGLDDSNNDCDVCPPGPPGPLGPPGPPGMKGPKGKHGIPGENGRAGHNAAAGIRGDVGFQGAPGLAGLSGLPGPMVLNGRGLPGAAGQPGTSGKQGRPGIPGREGKSCQGVPGPRGRIGEKGMRGLSGARGAKGRAGFTSINKGYCTCPERTASLMRVIIQPLRHRGDSKKKLLNKKYSNTV